MNLPPSSAIAPAIAVAPPETFMEKFSEEPSGGEAHLLFRVQGALFAVEAALVREIFALPELAPLAQAPPFVLGVLNLRGSFVPVMDLARRLGGAGHRPQTSDILIVLEWPGVRVGVLVHEVMHVAPIALSEQEELPPVGRSTSEAAFIRGIAHIDGATAMLLHTQNLLRIDMPSPTVAPVAVPVAVPFVDGEVREQSGYFALNASQEERAVFAERARRLGRAVGAQESSDLVPLAIVSLGGEPFGIGLESVREFCRAGVVTPVPCCPPHIVGQMNLRGDILTLLDIRHLLRLPLAARSDAPRVVVAQSEGVSVGVLVDEVVDVIYLPHSDLRAAPGAAGEGGKYFSGGVLHGERILGLLDLPRVLGEESLAVDESV